MSKNALRLNERGSLPIVKIAEVRGTRLFPSRAPFEFLINATSAIWIQHLILDAWKYLGIPSLKTLKDDVDSDTLR